MGFEQEERDAHLAASEHYEFWRAADVTFAVLTTVALVFNVCQLYTILRSPGLRRSSTMQLVGGWCTRTLPARDHETRASVLPPSTLPFRRAAGLALSDLAFVAFGCQHYLRQAIYGQLLPYHHVYYQL